MVSITVNHAASPAKDVIQQWMAACSQTLADYDVDAHLALISKNVKVHGVPQLGIIDYKDWAAQVRHEFSDKLVKSVTFQGDQLRAINDDNIMFTTLETVTASDGTVIKNGLEVLLNKEDDGVWRVLQERILNEDEMRHFGLIA